MRLSTWPKISVEKELTGRSLPVCGDRIEDVWDPRHCSKSHPDAVAAVGGRNHSRAAHSQHGRPWDDRQNHQAWSSPCIAPCCRSAADRSRRVACPHTRSRPSADTAWLSSADPRAHSSRSSSPLPWQRSRESEARCSRLGPRVPEGRAAKLLPQATQIRLPRGRHQGGLASHLQPSSLAAPVPPLVQRGVSRQPPRSSAWPLRHLC